MPTNLYYDNPERYDDFIYWMTPHMAPPKGQVSHLDVNKNPVYKKENGKYIPIEKHTHAVVQLNKEIAAAEKRADEILNFIDYTESSDGTNNGNGECYNSIEIEVVDYAQEMPTFFKFMNVKDHRFHQYTRKNYKRLSSHSTTIAPVTVNRIKTRGECAERGGNFK